MVDLLFLPFDASALFALTLTGDNVKEFIFCLKLLVDLMLIYRNEFRDVGLLKSLTVNRRAKSNPEVDNFR